MRYDNLQSERAQIPGDPYSKGDLERFQDYRQKTHEHCHTWSWRLWVTGDPETRRRLTSSEAQINLVGENDYPQYLYRIHDVYNLE